MKAPTTAAAKRLVFITGLVLFGQTISCATTQHYVMKNVSNSVHLQDSAAHGFTHVNVYDREDQLVVYGRITHRHHFCASEGHVDLAILPDDGPSVYSTSIPIVRRASRRYGWHRAAFRAKLPIRIQKGHSIHLVFHDDDCILPETFDCQDNQAAVGASDMHRTARCVLGKAGERVSSSTP